MMNLDNLDTLTSTSVEGALVCMLLVVAYKLYRCKIHSHSGCCSDHFRLETSNQANTDTDLPFTEDTKSSLSEVII